MDIYGNCFGFNFGKFTDICNPKKLAINGLIASIYCKALQLFSFNITIFHKLIYKQTEGR